MDGICASTGKLLRSVALRYRRPLREGSGWLPLRVRACRHLLVDRSADDVAAGSGPGARTARLARLEAVLFLSQQPQGSRKLAQLAGLADGTKARTLVRTLNRLYDAQRSAFRVEEVAGGFQLMSRPKFAPWLRRLHSAPVEVHLSTPAMETLAVVAYRQPVLRATIEAIRGVQCGEILRQLVERDLVRIAGRSEELGRPLLYGTTRRFLQVFGLRHLEELPRRESLRVAPCDGEHTHDAPAEQAGADQQTPNRLDNSSEGEQEAKVKNPANTMLPEAELAGEPLAAVVGPQRNEQPDDEQTFLAPSDDSDDDEDEYEDEYDDEEEYDDDEYEDEYDDEDDEYDDDDDHEEEDEDDDGFEDEPWEEVADEDDEEDEDWEDDDEDWEDDDWEDEPEEEP